MIIVNIIGGLGNQMFQYACGQALSLRTEQPLHIATDQLDGYALHNGFELQRVFYVEAPQATAVELKRLLGWQAPPPLRRLFGRPTMHWAVGRKWCIEPYFQYWSGINDVRAPIYLHGYWQSERYFRDVADQIREDFNFRMPWDDADLAVHARMRAQPSASLHVRRTDYTLSKNQGVYAQLGIDYYRDAIRLVRQRVPGVRLFAFSDDPDWVDTQLGPEFGPIETVRHNSGERSANDMRLMSQADHHIIANSSFSWWGAWLNPSPDKIVVAPCRWFLNGTDDRDLIPSSWIRI
jgi:Glycosyl transferase family 11